MSARAASTRMRVTAIVSGTLTHSSSAWAPSPPIAGVSYWADAAFIAASAQ